MIKLTRYGFILFVVLLVGLTVLAYNTRVAYATEAEEAEAEEVEPEEAESEALSVDADKKAAIDAANRAIRRIPSAEHISFLDPTIESDVTGARALVDTAIEDYGAVKADFPELDKLEAVEWQVERLKAIQAAKDAIDAIPPPA